MTEDEGCTWSLGRVLTDSGKLYDAPNVVMSKLKHREAKETYLEQSPDNTEAIAHKTGGYWLKYFELRELIEVGFIVDMFTCAVFARLRPHFDQDGRFKPNLALLNSDRLKESDLDFR